MSQILEIRLLPPLAIARLGGAGTPMENFSVTVPDTTSLDWRSVQPAETLEVDPTTGEISRAYVPEELRFKEGDLIRPVSPFLEVWALFSDSDALEPLTVERLGSAGVDSISWAVDVANHKVFRRTQNPKDKVSASTSIEGGQHDKKPLVGQCDNFVSGKTVPLGHVQFIRPSARFPEIRFRFTPAGGWVYGPEGDDASFLKDQVYRKDGDWVGYNDGSSPSEIVRTTQPGFIYAQDDKQNSLGYIDDACDGVVKVSIKLANGDTLESSAHISSGPPDFAPDSRPPRIVLDELQMWLDGPEFDGDATNQEVRELLRRAFETVRLMNTTAMNGNAIDGQDNVASTMARQDANDYRRFYAPILNPSNVDNAAVQSIHENIYALLTSETPPWFAAAFRKYTEIGDLTDEGRRKMPAMMRNADGRGLCLTRRLFDLIEKASKATANGINTQS